MHLRIFSFFAFVAIPIGAQQANTTVTGSSESTTEASPMTAIRVEVFYEALCYDSVNFIKDNVWPTWNVLKDYFIIDWVPYGKARHWRADQSSRYLFLCQHGENECKGNLLQACGIEVLSSEDTMQWINCLMRDVSPHRAGKKCCDRLGLDYKPIQECIVNGKGNELLAAYGNRTHALRPSLTFVPTVTFDGVYSRNRQSSSLHNFKGVICSLISGTKPSICIN